MFYFTKGDTKKFFFLKSSGNNRAVRIQYDVLLYLRRDKNGMCLMCIESKKLYLLMMQHLAPDSK